jgi:hypothetical protein
VGVYLIALSTRINSSRRMDSSSALISVSPGAADGGDDNVLRGGEIDGLTGDIAQQRGDLNRVQRDLVLPGVGPREPEQVIHEGGGALGFAKDLPHAVRQLLAVPLTQQARIPRRSGSALWAPAVHARRRR